MSSTFPIQNVITVKEVLSPLNCVLVVEYAIREIKLVRRALQ